MTEDTAVKVCVRVRPLIEREKSATGENAQPPTLHWKADNNSVHQVEDGTSGKSFSFDHVFTACESTNQLYQAIAKPLVVSTVQGYNGTIFAYGQTSSGKTFTMMGCDKTPGVLPLAVEDVFQTIQNCPKKEFLLRVSYMEIYNETVTDLLVDSWKRKPLEVRETINKNIYVADLTEELVTSPAQALHWIRLGEKNRHYGKTKINQRSSRSHTIFRMILESRERSDSENADGAIIVSHLNLVDLAGSERASQTGAEGARFKEGCNINLSLFTLGQVIKKLTDESQKGFINYRDSKLTRILQNSLGGNAKTVIICTITLVTFDETLSTLQFASTAKKMKNDPHVTEVSDDGALLKRYRNEITDLKRRLLEVSSETQTTATEKELLSQLLQEKDQLQREQEDRIRNLTNLLVSSNSNIATARPVPKRRVTWGGPMLKLASGSSAASELSLTEASTKKRKANSSCIELEADEEFYPHWEILDEAPEDMDSSHVTACSFGDSPKDVPPDHLRELCEKMSMLEQQLEMERHQRSDAQSKVIALELQLQEQLQQRCKTQLEDVEQMKRQFSEAIQLCESLASEKDLLVTERNYLKEELGMSLEQIKTLEKETADLSQELEEKRELDEFEILEEQINKGNEDELHEEISQLKIILESSEQKCQDLQKEFKSLSVELKKKCDFIEELQKMNGKDLVEEVTMLRRSLDDAEMISLDTKKEWACLRSQNMTLEDKNVILTLDNEKNEKDAMSLRSQLEMEKAKYKKMQFDLQKELNIAFEENIKLSSLLDGKVPKNLIDNVELERSVAKLNKKLASCHEANSDLQLKLEQEHQVEMNEVMTQLEENEHLCVCLTVELHELHQLKRDLEEKLTDCEKSRRADKDIQKELEEHVQQLTAELQSVQAQKEAAMGECESRLQSVCSERDVPQQRMDQELVKWQLEKGTESCVEVLKEERDQLKADLKENIEMMIEIQEEVRVLQEKNLKQKECIHKLETAQIQVCVASEAEHLKAQIKSLEEELQHVEADRGRSTEEMDELVSRLSALTGEREQLQRDLDALTQDRTHMKQEMQRIVQSLEQMLQEQNQKNLDLERLSQDRLTELERQTKELQRVEADSRRSTEELVSRVSALTEEREQLQQALDALSKNQQLLDNRTHMEQLQNELNQAETQEYMAKLQQEKEELQASLQTVRLDKGQLESELQKNVQKMKTLEEELQRVEAVHGRSTEEMEALVSRVSALTEDRKQLQQALDAVTQEDNSTDLLQVQITQLNESVQSVTEQKNRLEQELLLNKAELQASLQTVNADKSQLESDLQQNMQKLDEMQRRVQSLEQMLQEQNHKDLERLSQDRLTALARQTKDLQRVEADSRRSTEELVSRVSALTEEREQLQQAFDALIQEKQQLLDNRTHMEQLQNELNQEIQEYMAKLQQEKEELQTVRADKSQLESDLQKYMQKMKTLEEELQRVEAVHGRSTEEMEELVSRVSALTEDQDQLQQALDALTQEKQQLQQHLDSKTDSLQVQIIQLNECVQSVTEQKSHLEQELHSNIEKVSQFDELLHKLQEEKRSLEEKLHNNMETMSRTQQLLSSVQEELCEQKRINRELSQMHSTLNQQEMVRTTEAQFLELSLSKDKQTICDLKEQMSFAPEELLLDASNLHLQESFNKFKKVINVCGDNMSMNLKMVLPAPSCLSSLPKHTIESINTVNNVCVQALKILSVMAVQLHKSALSFQQLFEDLLKKDLAVFEEQRLQDVLLCRALAPSFSIKHMDFVSQWKLRLKELLEKRQLYLQKLDSVVDRMQNVYYREGFSEIQEMKRYEATQQAICASEPVDVSALDSFLDAQLQLRNTMIQKRNSLLEAITEEHGHLLKELSQQAAQAQALLEEEKSKRFTLQHGLEEAPLKTEASLLKDILELQDHLRIAKDQLQIATLEKEELQKAQVKAEHQVSCHKKATQLLQTELQDTRAKLQESERSIEELRSRRQPCETEVTSANVEKLKSKVSKLEMELQAAAEKYNQDIQKLTSVLEGKTTSLRRLKETLRSQQEKDQQYLEGEALHARLVQPKGLVQTHVLLEKSKLEEETRQLKLRVTELESLVTSLQADVAKWKQRALKMKSESEAKSKRGLQAGFECTPPKRQRCDSPRKALDSPALSLLNSPKSRFFDGASSSEFLAKNCPKQFFDNSGLGTPPVEGGSKPDWLEWPLSPKEDQICKKQ